MKNTLTVLKNENFQLDYALQKNILEVFEEFNQRIEWGISADTARKHKNFLKNFKSFLENIGTPDLPLTEIKCSLMEKFLQWLIIRLRAVSVSPAYKDKIIVSSLHAAKHIEHLKRVMNHAVMFEYIQYNPIAPFKVKRGKIKEVVHLSDDEFRLWMNAKWERKSFVTVQDLYTFQIATGLSYSDVFTYKTITDPKTGLWIESQRNKTSRPFYIPLFHKEFKVALDLHNKYKGKMPYLANQTYNKCLKIMAHELGINKQLTTHTGRKTFATIKDGQGWSTGVIASMLGNTEDVCRKHYVKVSKKKIESELNRIYSH